MKILVLHYREFEKLPSGGHKTENCPKQRGKAVLPRHLTEEQGLRDQRGTVGNLSRPMG